jgi:deoxyribose-phosphate aldolase
MEVEMDNLSKYFDHTILKPDADVAQVKSVVAEAIQNGLASVCVNQYRTKMVAELLKGSDVKTCTVVGFPLGAVDSEIKAYETSKAIADGANEIDMVINIGAVKDKNYEYVLNDIKAVRDACTGKILKVILETCLLDDEEKIKVCELAKEAGADFVKTSTGFSTSGAKTEDVRLMRKTVGESMGVKASGGIRDIETAEKMIEAGATRLGTSKLILSE